MHRYKKPVKKSKQRRGKGANLTKLTKGKSKRRRASPRKRKGDPGVPHFKKKGRQRGHPQSREGERQKDERYSHPAEFRGQ